METPQALLWGIYRCGKGCRSLGGAYAPDQKIVDVSGLEMAYSGASDASFKL